MSYVVSKSGASSCVSCFFDSLRFLATPCKRPFAKFLETQTIAGCCILVQQPLSALEGRCSFGPETSNHSRQ
jgi:hypothetical protein